MLIKTIDKTIQSYQILSYHRLTNIYTTRPLNMKKKVVGHKIVIYLFQFCHSITEYIVQTYSKHNG